MVSLRHTKKEHVHIFIAVLLLGALLISSWLRFFPVPHAEATHWFDAVGTDYQFRKLITFDRSLVPTTQTNFPMLVSLTHADLIQDPDGCTVGVPPIIGPCHASGWDIIFTNNPNPDAPPVQLDHEIEKYDPATGEIVMWVRIPILNGVGATSDTSIYIYYGKDGVVISPENITATWSEGGANNFKGVWHMANTSAGAGAFTDSTITNANNGTGSGGVSLASIAGRVGRAYSFDGIDDFVDIGDKASLFTAGSFTVEAWARKSVDIANAFGSYVFSDYDSAGGASSFSLRVDGPDTFSFHWTSPEFATAATPISVINTWYHVVATWDGTTRRIYVDSVERGTNAIFQARSDIVSIAAIGKAGSYAPAPPVNPGDGFNFPGSIDEVRFSASARSTQWITTEYNNQNNQGYRPTQPAAFILALGGEEQSNAAPTVPSLAEISAFANWHTNDQTPLLGTFSSTDTEPIEYEIRWDDNVDCLSPLGTSIIGPFPSGQPTSYQTVSALANGTYWWCARARDPAGSNSWSALSASRSLTVDTSLTADAWLQTTSEQFTTVLTDPDNILTDTEASPPGGVKLKGW